MSEPLREDAASASTEACAVRPENVRAVRLGHGANCSSVGSVVDTLFLSAAAASAIFAAICAAMDGEPIRVTGTANAEDDDGDDGTGEARR